MEGKLKLPGGPELPVWGGVEVAEPFANVVNAKFAEATVIPFKVLLA